MLRVECSNGRVGKEIKMKRIRRFSVIAALVVGSVLTVSAPPAVAASKVAKPPPPVDARILIKSVDLKAGTVTFRYMRSAKAPDHTYAIDGTTQLKVNNVAGKITDIKSGMVVSSYLERDNDNLDGLELSGYGEQPAAAKPKKPAKPKPPTSAPTP